jgi:hypothetical protein
MAEPAIEICQNADCESSEGVRNGRARGEFHVCKKVDSVASRSNKDHCRHLLILGLHRKGSEEDVEGNEQEIPVGVQWRVALGAVGGVRVNGAVYGSAHCDAVSQEQRVYDGKDKPNRTGNNGAGLQLQGGTENKLGMLAIVDTWWAQELTYPARENHGNGTLGNGGEAEDAAVVDAAKGTCQEAHQYGR